MDYYSYLYYHYSHINYSQVGGIQEQFRRTPLSGFIVPSPQPSIAKLNKSNFYKRCLDYFH